MAKQLRGVMAALLTPFNNQQALDKESLRRLVQFNIQQGIDGLYVGGSTGEAFVQSLSEREQVLEIVAEEAKGKITLIAHVGCVSTAESQQLAASASRFGFDAVSAVTPFYYPFSFEEHCDHYRAIIDSSNGLPMVVYNIPALSGVKLTLDQINTLVTLPGVGALKQRRAISSRWNRSAARIRIWCSITAMTRSSLQVCWQALMAVSAARTTLWAGATRPSPKLSARVTTRRPSTCKVSAIKLSIC
ncbi:N-acetylneuraminate lyase [Lelliottia amnigena]|nr:N-acetylneuraminate lyase [Lelliottia amnigena]